MQEEDFGGDFKAAMERNKAFEAKVNDLTETISNNIIELIRQEAMFTFRNYFSGIESDILTPLNISLKNKDNATTFYASTTQEFKKIVASIEKEEKKKGLEDNLNEKGEELLFKLRSMPYDIAQTMGPGVNKSITSSTSKTIMNEVFENSPVLKELIDHLLEKNQLPEAFIYKRGFSNIRGTNNCNTEIIFLFIINC